MAKLYFKVGSDVDKVIQLRQEIAKLKQELMSMDVNKAPAAAKALEIQIGAASQEMRGLVSTAAQAGATIENDFKKKIFDSSKVVNTLSQKIIDQRVVIRDVEADVRKLSDAYRGMDKNTTKGNASLKELNSSKRALQEEKNALFGLQTEQWNARLSVKKLKDEYASFNEESKKTVESNDESSISFGKVMAAIGGVAALNKLGSEIIRVRGEFQQLDVTFTTLLQSKEKANALMSQMVDTAAKTPFSLTELASGAKQLVAYGFASEGVNDDLVRLGNIASGLGLPLERLTYLYGTTMTQGRLYARDMMQFTTSGIPMLQGLADMYGKTTNEVNAMVTAGKIGFPEVQKVIENMTNEGGKFYNLMEEQSKTITGRISNLGDAMDEMFNKIGKSNEGIINGSIDGAKYLIENYEMIGKILVGLIGTYGTYKAATIAYYAITKTYGIYDIATKELQFAATMKNVAVTNAMIIKQKMLNATMLKNPYVLAATLVFGLVAAMWALHDGTTAAEKAQNSYNEKVEKAAKIEQEHKQKLEELISELQNEVTAETRKMKILDEIKRGYPQMFKFFIDEKGHVKDLTKAWKEYNEVTSKKKARDNKQNVSSTKQNLKEYREMFALWEKYGEDPNFHKNDLSDNEKDLASKYSNETLGRLKEKIESDERELWTWEKVVRDDELTKWKVDLKGKTDKQISAIRSSLLAKAKASNGDRNLTIALGKRIKGIDDESNSRKTVDKTQNKSYWETKKKEAQAELDALTNIEAAGKKGDALKVKIAEYEDKLIPFSTNTTKQESAAEKLRKQNEKLIKLTDKNLREQIRAEEDLQNQVDQSRIDAMKDGSDKTIEQMQLNHKKEMQQFEREKEDKLRKAIDNARDVFDADTKNKGKTFNASNIKLSDDDNKKYSEQKMYLEIKQFGEVQTLLDKERQSWNDYLAEYGSFQEKRQAITTIYNEKIASASTDGEKGSLKKELENKQKDLNIEELKSSINFADIFGNLDTQSTELLSIMRDKLKEVINKSAKDLKPTDLKALQDAFKDIDFKISERSPFNELKQGAKEYITSTKDVIHAQEDLNTVMKGGEVIVGTYIDSTGKLCTKLLTQEKAEKNLSTAQSNRQTTLSKLTKAANSIGSKGTEVVNAGNEIVGMLENFGVAVPEAVGETLNGIGQIMSALENIDITKPFSAVTSAIGVLAGIGNTIAGLFGFSKYDYSHYNEMVEQYDTLNTIWDELIDKKKEYIDTSYGEEANKAGREALELAQKSIESYKILGKERLNEGASPGSHSIGVRIKKGMSDEGWNEAKKSLGWEFDKVTDGRMDGLFNLSIEQLDKLKSEAPTFWAKLDGDVRGYLDNIIQGEERLEDIQNQLKEQLTQVSFDSVFDSFTDTLMDMDSSAEDFSNNFEEYMQRAILTTMVGDKYKEKLKGWYDNFAKANDDKAGITKDELDKSQKEWDSIVADAVAERDKLKDVFGWTSDKSTSQSSTKGGFETMPKDTGEELNGRFTALQIAGEEVKSQSILQSQSLNILTAKADTILTVNFDTRNIADETRTILANSYLELQEISENTGAIIKPIKDMNDKLDKIEKNTSKL